MVEVELTKEEKEILNKGVTKIIESFIKVRDSEIIEDIQTELKVINKFNEDNDVMKAMDIIDKYDN